MFGFSVICLWINQSFVVLVFWFWNLECDKLFLHGCYNNKLFFLQIHAWSDQYFFWWRLWQSGSFFHFQSFLNFISLILMIFIFWIIIFGLWYSLKFALSLKHYRKIMPNFAIDECFFFYYQIPNSLVFYFLLLNRKDNYIVDLLHILGHSSNWP